MPQWRGGVRMRLRTGAAVHRDKTKLEDRYERDVLTPRKLVGEIAAFRFQSVKLRLADKTWYTPDYEVQDRDGLVSYHEVKGYWEEDARVKFKMAIELYPEREFLEVTWDRKTGWVLRPHRVTNPAATD